MCSECVNLHVAVNQAYFGGFWMGMFEGPSAKRHQIWSSDEAVVQSLIDKAETMEPGKTFAKTLCNSYVDKHGIRRHTGKRKS